MFRRRTRFRQGRAEAQSAQADEAEAGANGRDAFATEALSYVHGLYGAALRLTRNPPDAEDLVQNTYLKAFRFASRFERGTNLKAWLFTILHNTFLNDQRHGGRDPVAVDSAVVEQAGARPETVETPEQILMRATLDHDLQAALDSLPDSFRQAVWLRDVEEFTYAEIAHILDVPLGTVMSRISRGRRLLYDRLSAARPSAARTAQPRPGAVAAARRVEVAPTER